MDHRIHPAVGAHEGIPESLHGAQVGQVDRFGLCRSPGRGHRIGHLLGQRQVPVDDHQPSDPGQRLGYATPPSARAEHHNHRSVRTSLRLIHKATFPVMPLVDSNGSANFLRNAS